MVGFLIEKFGGESFTAFCRELRDGESFGQALKSAYTTITTIAEFEKRWKEYLDQLYYEGRPKVHAGTSPVISSEKEVMEKWVDNDGRKGYHVRIFKK